MDESNEETQAIPNPTEHQNDTRNGDSKCGFSDIFSDFFLPIFSIVTYIFDVGSDLWLAISYARGGHWWWCGWTVLFVVMSALAMAYVSYVYLSDEEDNLLYITNPVLRVFAMIVVAFSLTSPVLG